MDILYVIATLPYKKEICKFLAEKGICKAVSWIYGKIKTPPIEKAYKEALKKWNTHHYVKGYYKEHRFDTLEDFSKYVMSMVDMHGDENMVELFRLFEDELKKDATTYDYLIELREKAIEMGLESLISEVTAIRKTMKDHSQLLFDLRKKISNHHKGQRGPFNRPKEYLIQRYCSYKLETEDYVKYFLEHKEIKSYPLVEYVLGNTDYSSTKYVLYSDAHAGKTTELRKLCYDIQENGMYVPILFEVKHHPDLLQDLPAFDDEDDSGIVLVIDALDECFDGEERYQLFNEIEGYAKEHPQIRIVLSCRSNIKGESKLEGFKPLNLDGLKQEDITTYLNDKNLVSLEDEIEAKGLWDLVRTPFLLMAITDYYQEKKSLPENKVELFDFFIDQRLKRELNKMSHRKALKLKKSLSTLQSLAVALQLLEVNQLCEDKVYYLMGDDNELLDVTLRTSFIEVTENGGYGFAHNTYKEHFVAKYLYALGNIDKIQQLCCYHGNKTVKTSWYNIVALMLSSMPNEDALSSAIKNWIVNDNKEMVLYIDQKMLSPEQRTSVVIDILENCKKKNVRFGDFYTSQYKELMEFGEPMQMVVYLERELKACKTRDCHMANLLFMMHYLNWQMLPSNKRKALEKVMISTFGRLIKIEETAYPLFVAFSNPWLLRKEMVDKVYSKVKGSEQPEVVNQFVEYLNESGFAEDYIGVIIGMSKHIHSYVRHGARCSVTKEHLHDAYKAVTMWKNIQIVLKQLAKEISEHHYSYDSEIRDYNEMMDSLLNKVAQMTKKYPQRADFVFEVLIDMAEERRDLKRVGTDPFVEFFEKTGNTQHFFEQSLSKLKEKLFDRKEWGDKFHDYYRMLEAYAYSTSLFLTEERIEEICAGFENNSFEGYHLLSWIMQTASDEMKGVIEIILKNRYPSHWKDPHKLSAWELKRQSDFDELLDYDTFKDAVLKVIEEKSPKNKKDIKELRKVKVKFSDDEEEKINDYVFSLLYDFTSNDDSVDLDGVRHFVCNEKAYHGFVVEKTAERLYRSDKEITLSEKQKIVYESAVREILIDLSEVPFYPMYLHKCPAITALLHHDVSIEKVILLKLLPYSCNSIYIKEKLNFGRNYYLFDYIKEQFEDDEMSFIRALQLCMDKEEVLFEENLKLWGRYIVRTGITTEIPRIKKWLRTMDDGDAAYSIIKAMTERTDTRDIVMKSAFLRGLSAEKKEYVYELLATDDTLDEFVRNGLERLFNRLGDNEKGRAIHYLFAKGSIKALRYLSKHLSMFGRNYAMNYRSLEALPLLIKLYVTTIDFQPRYEYSCLLNAMEQIATANDDNWIVVKTELEKLIAKDRKYVGLNWYLDKWENLYWERRTKKMSFDEVKDLLCA